VVDRVRVFGGFVSRAGLALLREVGGDGSIDGGALGAPFAVRFYESFWHDDLETAREAARAYRSLMSQLIRPDWSGTFASPQSQIKAAMKLLGQPGGFPRPPLLPLEDSALLAQLQQILERARGELRREPASFGPWVRGERHPIQPWAWRCQNEGTGETATVELVFGPDEAIGDPRVHAPREPQRVYAVPPSRQRAAPGRSHPMQTHQNHHPVLLPVLSPWLGRTRAPRSSHPGEPRL